ncbi:transcription factor GTE12 [Silene latifolia]|uniref:transcription factor GTE12 n=1 Tax=Silene latifolia TaxID=37657 RepID=UPI003D771BA2
MGKSFDVATAVVDKPVVVKKLKIKILAKKPENGVGDISKQVEEQNCAKRLSSTDDRTPNAVAAQKVYSDMRKKPMDGGSQLSGERCLGKSSLIGNSTRRACGNENSKTIVGKKRGYEGLSDCQESKRLKMDCIATSRCQSVLLKLMKHKFAKPFLDPVNPAAWGIHDYFDIIKHPMDLGTVKTKLHRNTYISAEEFEADVRLTFSNAMLYNPSNNWVHQHAKRLSEVFDCEWKPVKAMLFRDNKNVIRKRAEVGVDKSAFSVRSKVVEGHSACGDAVRNTMLQKENRSENLHKVSFEVWGSDGQGVKDHMPQSSKQLRFSPKFNGPVSCREKESDCPMSTKANHGSSDRVKVPTELNDIEVKNSSTVQVTKSDQDSEGAVSCLDEELAGASKPSTTTGSYDSIKQSLETALDIELSPSKALRAAKLRSRFAATILKAQNKTLLQPVGRTDAAILEQEKEILVRKQREERARIEAQVRAAELAARSKAESEFRKQRQEAREAARAALEKMERSINLDDNFHTLRDLEALLGTSSSFVVCHDNRSHRAWNQIGSNELGSPLERLGLYIKAEYRVGDDDDDDELEEGEVPS